MYAIIHGGAVKGYCDKPRYVMDNNGVFVQTKECNATHVAIGGEAYALLETIVKEVDGGEVAFTQDVKLNDVEEGVTETEDALCGFSAETEERLSDIEDALCEITKEV